jgi:hypothetical protein
MRNLDIPLTDLDADTLVELLVQIEQEARTVQAARYRVLAALARDPLYTSGPAQGAAAEVACALRISERCAQQQVADAQVLEELFPDTLGALQAGSVQTIQVRALIEATTGLSEESARVVEAIVLPRMGGQNPAATCKALTRAVLKADPQAAEQRRAHAVRERRVERYAQPDGMATLAATLPAEQAVHAMNVIDAHARAAKDERTLDQRRADAFYHLVTGNLTQRPAAVVNVTVPLDTLLGIGHEPGELEGYGALTAHTARELAAEADSVWRRLLTAPTTGLVVKTDPHTYRPTAEVRRHVSARDGHCSFPTCSMPASKTDLDHIVPFNHKNPAHGGPTTPDNLQPLCRRHHRLKTHANWTVHHSETHVNTTTWTSPSGRRYELVA